MARQTLQQHQDKIKNWTPRGLAILEYRMEKVARIMLADAQRNKLRASPGFNPNILHEVSGNLIRSLTVKMTTSKTSVTGQVGTNLTNRGYSYPRAHEYGLGKMPARSWLRPSIAGRQDMLRSEVKQAWTEAYG